MVRIAILGAAGRMGRTLIRCAAGLPNVRVTAAVDVAGCPAAGQDSGLLAGVGANGVPVSVDLAAACAIADVAIDFTFHSAVPVNAGVAAARGVALVIGTTGLDAQETAGVHDAAKRIPILWAPNMSLGVNLLFALTQKAAAVLDTTYDIEIVETHHRHKKDAPSGTALRLAERAAAGRGVDLNTVANFGRQGLVGERPVGQIAMHSVRVGDVVGDHTVTFGTDGERIELSHRASSRDVFAKGALHAAQWVAGRAAGLYDMQDVLGL
jgi:4-hydroxy-tetrahydrodipicolinate reductase